MKKVVYYILIMAVVGAVGIGVGVVNFYLGPAGNAGTDEKIEVRVAKGDGIDEISRNLHGGGLIKNEAVFKAYALISGSANKFKPGRYEFSFGNSAIEIVRQLVLGPKNATITISPGMTLKEIDDLLASNGIVPDGGIENLDLASLNDEYPYLKSANSLEGYLFPDTYEFAYDSDAGRIVSRILDNFDEKVIHSIRDLQTKQSGQSDDGKNGAVDNSGRVGLTGLQNTFDNDNIDWLILASILEKEVIGEVDARIVSGILQKRIANGMRLQVDASVIYAVCGGKFIGCQALMKSDFDNNSKYNTYRHGGYPPGPISNPGMVSVEAALNPVKTDYLYYLTDPKTRKTIFSKTFAEHLANTEKYLR